MCVFSAFFHKSTSHNSRNRWHPKHKKKISRQQQRSIVRKVAQKLFLLLWQTLKCQKISIYKCDFFCHLIQKVFCHLDILRQCLALSFCQGCWEEARMSKGSPDLCKWIFFAISTFAIIEEIASTQSLFPFLFSWIFLPSWLVADNFQIWQIGDQLLTFFDLNTALRKAAAAKIMMKKK